MILAASPRINEGIKWNAPSFYTTEHFATFHLRAKNGVTLVLHLGAAPRPDADMRATITDTGVAIEWKRDNRATVTVRDLDEVRRDSATLTRLVQAWIVCVR